MTAPTGPPPIEAQRLLNGFRGYQLLVTACRLQIPDRVAAGPIAVGDLAASTGLHASSLRRLLRGLAAWKLPIETPDGRYASTPLSDWFRADRPGLRNMTVMLGDEGYQEQSDVLPPNGQAGVRPCLWNQPLRAACRRSGGSGRVQCRHGGDIDPRRFGVLRCLRLPGRSHRG